MTLEEVLAQIESEDVKESIAGIVQQEKQKGIDTYNRKDKEALKWKHIVKDLGYDSEKYESPEEFVASKKEVTEKVKKSQGTISGLQEQLNDLTSQLATERELVAKEKRVAKESTIRSTLLSDIGNDFYGSKYMINDLITNNVVDTDGDSIVFKNGDKTLSYDEGVEWLKTENKDMLKVSQKSGTGDKGGSTPEINDNLLSKPADDILDSLGL